jgi:hypothetical protein
MNAPKHTGICGDFLSACELPSSRSSVMNGEVRRSQPNVSCFQIGNSFVNRTDIYRQAIKRTFANLYGVSADTVEVSWTSGESTTVQCAGKTFLHEIRSDPDDDAPEFLCPDEDPVIVNLTDDERSQLGLAV